MANGNGVTISKKTTVTLGFVIVLLGISFWFANIQGAVNSTVADVKEIKDTYLTAEVIDLKLLPIKDDVEDIKKDIKELLRR